MSFGSSVSPAREAASAPLPAEDAQVQPAEAATRAVALAERLAERAAAMDRPGAFPEEDFAWLAEAGFLAAPLPRQDGGWGFGTERGGTAPLLRVLRHIGRGNLSVGRLYEGHVNALLLIYRFGTRAQQRRYAAEARAGKRFAVWNTEGPDGLCLHPAGGQGYRLEGGKTFASGAGHVERPLVTGALPDGAGWQMLVVPADEVSASVDRSGWRPVGMRASASYAIDFSGARVSDDHLIGRAGNYHQQPWFSGGAIRFAAVQLGGAEAAFDLTRRHLRERGRTDDPHQRRRAAQMATALESGTLFLDRAAALADAFDAARNEPADGAPPQKTPPAENGASAAETPAARVVAYANVVRSAVERICLDVLEHAERSVGAQGMLQPHPLERVARDLTLYLRQPAPDAALDAAGAHVLASPRPIYRLWSDEA